MFCPHCGLEQPSDHRFCVSCGTRLPQDLLRGRGPKISRWFLGIPVVASDPPHAALRVTRYVDEVEFESAEGSVKVPSHHVRFSIWAGDRAVCAVSLPDDEAERLADFVLDRVPLPSA
jgi:hypothetical protein